MSKRYWIYNFIIAICLFCIMMIGFAVTKSCFGVTAVFSTLFALWSVIQFLMRKVDDAFDMPKYTKYKALDFALSITFANIVIVLLVNDYCRWLPEEIRWYCTISLVLTLSIVSSVFVIKEENRGNVKNK